MTTGGPPEWPPVVFFRLLPESADLVDEGAESFTPREFESEPKPVVRDGLEAVQCDREVIRQVSRGLQDPVRTVGGQGPPGGGGDERES